MSCPDGNCSEPSKRLRALIMLGLMMLVFIVLSGFSFLDSRGQVTPDQISFGPHPANDGKMVFQAYNCMGCHTIVGNGAYFAPDLTNEYQQAGPAWLAAFLPSARTWPTEAAVRTQLMNKDVAADAGVTTMEDYYAKYPGAKERIERRGGKPTYMPNLRFRSEEVHKLIAFLKYTAAMDNEGWPPELKTGTLEKRLSHLYAHPIEAPTTTATATATATATTSESAAADPSERGAQLAQQFACTACHSPGNQTLVGPSWSGLYGSESKLTTGEAVTVDDAYIIESIFKPNVKIVAGFLPGTMPPFEGLINESQAQDIVEYIKSLNSK